MSGIETVTGKVIDLLNPTPDQIDINDIAWALSRMPRLTGHTISEIPPNNAEHSIFVMKEVKDIVDAYLNGELQIGTSLHTKLSNLDLFKTGMTLKSYFGLLLKALLHDAQEYITGDIPSPVKRIPELRKVIKEIEAKLDDVIFQSFNLAPMTDDEKFIIKYADMIAQRIEMYNYLPSRGMQFNWVYEDISIDIDLAKLQKYEDPDHAIESYKKFLENFNKLYQSYIKTPNL